MTSISEKFNHMSESIPVMMCLTLSGGLQDAYSFKMRGGVFANAQTGNLVLLSMDIMEGKYGQCVRYLIPLLFFSLGIICAEIIHIRPNRFQNLHWRQEVLLAQIIFLFIVGFLPSSIDWLANSLISFTCAMQIQTFRVVKGSPYASTMCIGNLRSSMDHFTNFLKTKELKQLRLCFRYLFIILLFALGAILGSYLCDHYGSLSIWASCILLLIGFMLMFFKADVKEIKEGFSTRKH